MSSLGLAGIFGGAPSGKTEKKEDGEYIDGYKVADADDMDFLASLL